MVSGKIKILETIRQGSIGGGETYLMNLVLNLDKSQFVPVVLAFTDGEMISRLRAEGVKCFVIPTETPFDIRKYPQVISLISRENPDIVHFHGSRAGTNTLLPAKIKKKPVIYTVHGWSFHTGTAAAVQKGRIIAEKFLVSRCDKVVCGSEADIKNGKKFLKAGDYLLIHNSVDTEKFSPATKNKRVLSELGIKEDDFTVCFIARITYQKDPLTFIRAVKLVKEKRPEIKFVMIGDGDLKDTALAEADKLGVRNSIIFSPFRTDVVQVLASVDVFVLPSLWEVIPLAMLEAMAMEKICIATGIEGTTEALTHNENGLLFNPGDFAGLAEQIIMVYEQRDLAEKLRKKARETVVNSFDLKKLVKANEELYRKIYRSRQG